MKTNRSLFAIAAIALLALLLWLVFPKHASKAPAGPQLGAVRTAADRLHYPQGSPQLSFLDIRPAATTRLPALEPLAARIAYDEDHTARVSSPIAGRVLKIFAQAGDRVRAGEVLAEIDAPEYAEAQADQRKALADLQLKRSALKRAHALHDAGVIATRDFEEAQADASSAEAEHARANARLGNLGGTRNGHYVLRAPIAGTIAERHLNPAQELRPDLADPLFVITDPERFDVVADLSEQDAAHLSPGQSLKVEVDALGATSLNATVRKIGVALDPVSRRLPLRAHLEHGDPRLKAEMFARATPLAPSAQTVVAVPNTAILTNGLHSYVFIETEPGTLVKREVGFALRGHDTAYVAKGLKGGERVVTRGVLLLDADLGGEN